jgi:hypothetical protein
MKKLLLSLLAAIAISPLCQADTVTQREGFGEVHTRCLLKTGNGSFRLSPCRNVLISAAAPLGVTVKHEIGGTLIYTASYAWKDERHPNYYLTSVRQEIEDLSYRSAARVFYLDRQRRRISDSSFGLPNIWECYRQLHGDKITLCVWQKP